MVSAQTPVIYPSEMHLSRHPVGKSGSCSWRFCLSARTSTLSALTALASAELKIATITTMAKKMLRIFGLAILKFRLKILPKFPKTTKFENFLSG